MDDSPSKGSLAANCFIGTVVVVLTFSVIGKISDVLAPTGLLFLHNPVFGFVTNRTVWLGAILLEVCLLVFLVAGRSPGLRLGLIAWLSFILGVYRLGLHLLGRQEPCACLGQKLGRVFASTVSLDALALVLLIYMAAGSFGFLLWRWYSQARST